MKKPEMLFTAYDVSLKLGVSIIGLYKKLGNNCVPKKFIDGASHWLFTEEEIQELIRPLYKNINTGGNPNRLYKPKKKRKGGNI